jgi:ABC-2 type transport system ATP-binding protein
MSANAGPESGSPGTAYAIETEGLSKVYRGGRVRALTDVQLRVPAGSAFGLLGPNGAGKSTLVKCLLSIVRPTSGAATLFGQDIALPESRRPVGYLPEGHRFPAYLTGRGVLSYFGKLSGLSGEALEEDIEKKLALVGMQDWATTRVSRYSKGMLQRLGLAQAMLGTPKLVILDEPTDGVDPIGRHQIREVIRELTKQGTTVFLNSHLLLEVEQICDYVAILHHGRVLRQGKLEEVRRAVTERKPLLEVRFTTGPVPEEARTALAQLGPVRAAESGGLVVSLSDDAATSLAIDALRSHGVPIYSVEPTRVSLEEAFIELVSAESDQGVGGVRA